MTKEEYKTLINQYQHKTKDPTQRGFCGSFVGKDEHSFIGIIIDENLRNKTPMKQIIVLGHKSIIKRIDTTDINEVKEFMDTYFVKNDT